MTDIDTLFNQLQKSISKEAGVAIHKGGDMGLSSHVPFYIPTGIPPLDCIFRGGWPAGKIIELYGFEKSGKTAAALSAMAECNALGGYNLFIDTERSWDKERALSAGVDLDRTLVAETPSIESTFRMIENFLESIETASRGTPIVIVVDSITGATTEDELSNTLSSEARIGQEAKQIRRGIRRIVWQIAEKNVIMFFVNHAVSKMVSWGKSSQSAGGHALKFMSTIRIEFKDIGKILDPSNKSMLLGQKIQMEVEKFKGGSLHIFKIETELRNGLYNKVDGLLEAGLLLGVIEHPFRSKSYTIFPHTEDQKEFAKNHWESVVEEFGGYTSLYRKIFDFAIEQGRIQPWLTS